MSPLYFYEIPSNNNGKITADYYCKEILGKVVSEQISRSDKFVLQADRDSAYTAKRSIAFKESLGLEYYFTPGVSSDLSGSEVIISLFKTELRKTLRTTKEEVIKAARKAQKCILQDRINNIVLNMPMRYKKCVDLERQAILF